MKFFLLTSFFLYHLLSYAQTITQDTLLARQYFQIDDSILEVRANYDSSIHYFTKAGELYERHGLWEDFYICQNKIAENLYRSDRY